MIWEQSPFDDFLEVSAKAFLDLSCEKLDENFV